MSSENLAASPEPEGAVFGPDDLVVLRESLDQAREALPPESRTAENMDALAVAIMRVAKCGERDPVRLLVHALKAIGSEANHGAV